MDNVEHRPLKKQKCVHSENVEENDDLKTTCSKQIEQIPFFNDTLELQNNETVNISSSKKQTSYFNKDCQKFYSATKLISRGSPNSSSHSYAIAAGHLANTGTYNSKDIVGISAEGKRKGRISPSRDEIMLAIKAQVAMFITDNYKVRNSWYNLGEQEVVNILTENGYVDDQNKGHWVKSLPFID
jgi:hypothetical protein